MSLKTKVIAATTKKHTCPYVGCIFAFDRPWKLDRHLNTHTKQRPFKCDQTGCNKTYTNNSHLQRHKSITHDKNKPDPEQLPCPYTECTKVFANKWSLKKHINNHYFIACGKNVKKSCKLKYHICTHWKMDPFVCEICKESFKTRQEYKYHEKKHKVYYCEKEGCQEQFNSWNALRKHLKFTHPNKYQCDFCKKFYKNKWILREHVLSHLPLDKRDIIPCPYPDCERFYFYERNLDCHIRSFHLNVNYKCKINGCNKTFTIKRRLRDHQKKHSELNMNNSSFKPRKPRKPRKDKGLPKKSMAAALSGIVLPEYVDKALAQNNITPEVMDYIQNVKNILCEEIVFE